MKTQDMREQLAQMGNGAHALATQILGNADEAADAVHDAIAKVLGRPGSYDPKKGSLSPWFMRLVRNHCIDLLRRRRRSVMHWRRSSRNSARSSFCVITWTFRTRKLRRCSTWRPVR